MEAFLAAEGLVVAYCGVSCHVEAHFVDACHTKAAEVHCSPPHACLKAAMGLLPLAPSHQMTWRHMIHADQSWTMSWSIGSVKGHHDWQIYHPAKGVVRVGALWLCHCRNFHQSLAPLGSLVHAALQTPLAQTNFGRQTRRPAVGAARVGERAEALALW